MSNSPLASKLYKSDLLAKEPLLGRFLPALRSLQDPLFAAIIRAYPATYVKPEYGTGGRGVFRITCITAATASKEGTYRVEYGKARRKTFGLPKLLPWLRQQAQREVYIVQQGIPLLHFRGRPFDSRFMVQTNAQRTIRITGYAGRVAAPGRIVTNHSRGGKMHTLEPLFLAQGMTRAEVLTLLQETQRVVHMAANTLRKRHPFLRELGFDIGWDSQKHPWILEVNTRPQIRPFGELPDASMLRRMQYYRRNHSSVPARKRGANSPNPSTRKEKVVCDANR